MLEHFLSLCKKTFVSLKSEGVPVTLRKIARCLAAKLRSRRHFQALPLFDFIARENGQHKNVVILGPTIHWDYPMFQRPQQLALALAREGCFVVYLEHSPLYEDYKRIEEGLYRISAPDFGRLLDSLSGGVMIVPQGLYWNGRRAELLALAEVNFVIFEYLDHIDEQISGAQSAADLRDFLHFLVTGKSRIHFLATARSLRAELAQRGVSEVLLSPNGVDARHFTRRHNLPEDPVFRAIVAKGKPIIGYYGALAPWLNYQLLNEAARQRPEYEFVYIGLDYQHAASMLDSSPPNVSWLGPKEYQRLPDYASHFDVALIPFQPGNIARSTSPLKLFEYFALGLPVVVSAGMEECTAFREVLAAGSLQEFLACLQEALRLGADHNFTARLRARAEENSWRSRARDIRAFTEKEYAAYMRLHTVQADILKNGTALGMSPYYAQSYVRYELGYWYPAVQWLAELRGVRGILDIGGAYGTLLIYAGSYFPAARKVLLEKVPASSRAFQTRFGLEAHAMDVETDTLSHLGYFDLIILTEVIEHFNYAPKPTLRKIRSLLTRDGCFLLSTPDAATWGRISSPYKTLREIPEYTGQRQTWIDGHIWQYSKDELDALISECGFQVVHFAISRGYRGMRHLCYLLQKSSEVD